MSKKNRKPPSLDYSKFSLSAKQRAALLAQAGGDTQLEYGGQRDGLNARTQLEGGQSRLIDEAYTRYKTGLADADVLRRGALAAAGATTTGATTAANQSISDVFAQQDAGNASMDAITGASGGTGGAQFRAEMLKSIGQQGVDAQGARVATNAVNENYSGNLAGQAENNKEFYKQKSVDRMAGLSAEQRALALTMGQGKVKRKDELLDKLFAQWAEKEKIKLGNREVNVNDTNDDQDRATDDSNADADRNSREGAAGYKGDDSGGENKMTPKEKRTYNAQSSALKGYMYAADKLAHDQQYSLPGGKKDWAAIRNRLGLDGKNNEVVWNLTKDLVFPNANQLSPAGQALARGQYFKNQKLPSWMTDR